MISRLKGTDDILPPESAKWRTLLRAFEDLSERFGYEFALLPVMEPTELFARGVGESTEVVEKQMYTFTDRGDRSVTLRPELTAGMVRAFVEAGAQGTLKLAAAGPMFRYEQPQKGRRRQFFQVDFEYLGEASPDADVEVIELAYRLLESVHVPGIELKLNSIGDAGDRIAYREHLQRFLRGREKDLSEDGRRRIDTNPLRVLDSKTDAGVVADAPVPLDHLGTAAAAHFDAVKSGLESLEIQFEIDPRLVRGLDYYNRTVFEFFSSGFEAAQSALGGGGRYDPLAEAIGSSKAIPAVGAAMGCDRIVEAMPESPSPRLDVFVAVADPSRREEARRWVSLLRNEGRRVDWDPTPGRSLRGQFKAADRSGAAVVAIVGEEWGSGQVTVKRLETGDEELVAIEEVGSWSSR
ncbi:MAG TPA: histidine--tRNA ligase [Acidimicrobiia bacterium]|nr:histidine--tRNA ligase [Acidimicrobiia bacterium]